MADCVISSTSGFNENSRDAAPRRLEYGDDDNVDTDADADDDFLLCTFGEKNRRSMEKAAASFNRKEHCAMARAKIIVLYMIIRISIVIIYFL